MRITLDQGMLRCFTMGEEKIQDIKSIMELFLHYVLRGAKRKAYELAKQVVSTDALMFWAF